MSNEESRSLDILKLNIKINAIKIASMWLATIIIAWKVGKLTIVVENKFSTYDEAVKDVSELKQWKQKVEAYYYKPPTTAATLNQVK